MSEMQTNWVNLTIPSNNGVLEPNSEFAMTSVPERGFLVVDGGIGNNYSDLVNQTLTYFPNNNTWVNISLSGDAFAQMHSHTMTADAQGNTLYLWGGKTTFPDATGNYPVPNVMKMLNLETGVWSLLSSSPRNILPRVFHTAVLGKDRRTIYFIGGVKAVSAVNETTGTAYNYPEYASMAEIASYDTLNDSWNLLTTTGNVVPSMRISHTTTLIESGDIVLYGGYYQPFSANDTRQLSLSSDFFYLLNTDLMTWRNESIDATLGVGAGPLYQHTAVYPGKDCIFFLWGARGFSVSQIYILNTTQWKWTTTFDGMNPTPSVNTTEISTSQRGGLSTGTIAGIAVGVVAGVGVIAVAGFFLYRNRKNRAYYPKPLTAIMSHEDFSSTGYSSPQSQQGSRNKLDIVAGKPDMMAEKPDVHFS
ncbi:hypothetical protein BX666DRAFT_1942081 [Dichotomocladium elegans]|nr:hypothetical protein BX666DRAFT_1942081 [Dichotomocladium elegans]